MMSGPPTNVAAKQFFTDFLGFKPLVLASVLLLMLLRSLAEGAGYLLLLPLIASASAVGPTSANGFNESLHYLLALTGGDLSLEVVLAIFLVVMLLRAAIGYLSALVSNRHTESFVDHVRQRVYKAYSRSSWLHLATTKQAQDSHALTRQTDSVGVAAFYTFALAASSTTALIGLLVAAKVSPTLTLLIVTGALILALLLVPFQQRTYRRAFNTLHSLRTLHDALAARMGGLKLAKAFGVENDLEKDFAKCSSAYRNALLAEREFGARATLVQEAGAVILLVAMVYVATRWSSASNAELIVLIIIFARLMPLANAVQSNLRYLVATLPGYVALREMETRAKAHEEPILQGQSPLVLERSLELDRISFKYSPEGEWVLRDITLSLSARSAIGIIGLSGAGKSCLADIVAGLAPPSDGKLIVDGQVIGENERTQWRGGVTYVPQDAPLFHDTVRANLLIGASKATEEELWRCLALTGACDVVRKLPQGLETVVGDRGVKLSGGERQRLRLASALLRRPQLLILDEATSALNPTDEAEINRSLRTLLESMTIIIIAHRASSVAWTDQFIVLDWGRVAYAGRSRSAAMRAGGLECDLPEPQT